MSASAFLLQPIIRWNIDGHHLNFGPFGVSLKMLGGFKAANSPFDEKKNTISVCLIPGKEIKSAVKALKPVNVTEDTRWNISSTLQRSDCTLEGPLERGDYWIVVQSRYKDEPNLIRCRRRIKVV